MEIDKRVGVFMYCYVMPNKSVTVEKLIQAPF